MTRPGVVWVYSAIIVANILFTLVNLTGASAIIIGVISMVPSIGFLVQFFRLKRNSIFWLYGAIGLNVLMNAINKNWFGLVIALVFGWVVWDYIVNKKINEQEVFN